MEASGLFDLGSFPQSGFADFILMVGFSMFPRLLHFLKIVG